MVRCVALDGSARARQDLEPFAAHGPQLASLDGGDLVDASAIDHEDLARSTLRVLRLAGADLATRWEQSLQGVDAMVFAGLYPPIAVDPSARQLYVGALYRRPHEALFDEGLYALAFDDGAL